MSELTDTWSFNSNRNGMILGSAIKQMFHAFPVWYLKENK